MTIYHLLFACVAMLGIIGALMISQDEVSSDFLKLGGFLGVVLLVASFFEIRRDPKAFFHFVTTVALAVAIFAGVIWAYTKDHTAGLVTVVSIPAALGLSAWSLRLKR